MPDATRRIRTMTEADVGPCALLYHRAYELPCYGGTWDEAEAERIVRDLRRMSPQECWVAEEQGVLQGFILCSSLAGMRASVEEFAVVPECQGQGLGSALLEFVMDHYRRQGLTYIELVANCRAPAYDFYRRRGFSESQEYRLMSRRL